MLVPVLGDFVNIPPSGGGASVPGLPVWTFAASDSSDPAPGKFTTNAIAKSDTSLVYISITPKNGGDASNLQSVVVAGNLSCGVIMTDSSGYSDIGQFSSLAVTSFGLQFNIGFPSNGNWDGDYSFSFFPIMTGVTMPHILGNSLITPCADGTVSPVTSITTVQGIITAIS